MTREELDEVIYETLRETGHSTPVAAALVESISKKIIEEGVVKIK